MAASYGALAARHPRIFAALHPFLAIFFALRVFLLGLMWLPRHVAHPEPRTLWICLLGTAPVWGAWMLASGAWAWWRGVASRRGLGLGLRWRDRGMGRHHRHASYDALPTAEDGPVDEYYAEFGPRSPGTIRKAALSQTAPRRDPRSLSISTFLLYALLVFLGVYLVRTGTYDGDRRYKAAVDRANEGAVRREGLAGGERVFIAAMFHDNQAELPHWTKQMLRLIRYLGPDNVFVSIVESHSSDRTPTMLRDLDAQLVALEVPHRIIMSLSDEDLGVVRPKPGKTNPPRIEYLTAVRNVALEPLHRARGDNASVWAEMERDGYDAYAYAPGEVAWGHWDKVLFSNDVLMEAENFAELIHTRGGAYDMACGMDFAWWGLYDLWVARDRLGKSVSGLYPYFMEPKGFLSVLREEPVDVFTCWNGVVVLDAQPFLHPSGPSLRSGSSPSSSTQLSFRTSNLTAGECFSSEAFNMPYDLRLRAVSEGREPRVYMNPRVIGVYSWRFYGYYRWVLRHWAVRWWIERMEVGLVVPKDVAQKADGVESEVEERMEEAEERKLEMQAEAALARRIDAMRAALFILGSPKPPIVRSDEPVGMLPAESDGWECHQQSIA
ncbi:hypothetical protein HMN09_00480600 [Mycena chlorophos]|uniref:Glycosyltransferase family 69 protein n=1 Tax=Mycena chlorophos TaxID=658473 RepID=A0A8H6WM62_MYCCL|nr:hypothetical protein HMN09_00480600 [Mycena chlorophos]